MREIEVFLDLERVVALRRSIPVYLLRVRNFVPVTSAVTSLVVENVKVYFPMKGSWLVFTTTLPADLCLEAILLPRTCDFIVILSQMRPHSRFRLNAQLRNPPFQENVILIERLDL